MKVSARNWPRESKDVLYQTSLQKADDGKTQEKEAEVPAYLDTDKFESFPKFFGQDNEKSGSGFKMKSSTPDDSVGQLASMLARAETRMDVQQVSSKATRALISLKMSSISSDEGQRKKIAQMIKRMEKLIKRINKKLQLLSREEQIENRRKQAEKREDIQKQIELEKELQRKRKKRRRDERDYASKELAEDQKQSAQEMQEALSGLGSSSGGTEAGTDGSIDLAASAYSEPVTVAEGVSVDLSV